MTSVVAMRNYADADRAAVLAIFESNLPDYFSFSDRTWLEKTLDEPDGPAFVVTIDGTPAAFGGYELWDDYNKALLFWGMAARHYHGAGLGKLLLFERLLHIATVGRPPTRYVTVDTSLMVSPFFEHCGFELTSVWPEGYRSGATMHELRFDLSTTTSDLLRAARDASLAEANRRLCALSEQLGSPGPRLIDPRDEPQIPSETAQPISVFQLIP